MITFQTTAEGQTFLSPQNNPASFGETISGEAGLTFTATYSDTAGSDGGGGTTIYSSYQSSIEVIYQSADVNGNSTISNAGTAYLTQYSYFTVDDGTDITSSLETVSFETMSGNFSETQISDNTGYDDDGYMSSTTNGDTDFTSFSTFNTSFDPYPTTINYPVGTTTASISGSYYTIQDTTATVNTTTWGPTGSTYMVTSYETFVSISNAGNTHNAVGTAYQCETPFEAIWWITETDLEVGSFYALTDIGSSDTAYTAYPIPQSITETAIHYQGGPAPVGSEPTTSIIVGTSTITETFSATGFETNTLDITIPIMDTSYLLLPFSTYDLTLTTTDNFFVTQSGTASFGGTSLQTGYVSDLVTTILSSTYNIDVTYTHLTSNGFELTTLTDISTATQSYTYQSYNPDAVTHFDYSNTASFNESGSYTGYSQTVIGQAGSNTGLIGASLITVDVGTDLDGTPAVWFVIPNPYFEGIIEHGSDSVFNITDNVDVNYDVEGDFSSVFYPFMSTAVRDKHLILVTFDGQKTASYSDSDSNNVFNTYQWTANTDGPYINLTQGTQTTTAITSGSTTVEAMTTDGIISGSVSIHPDSNAIPASVREWVTYTNPEFEGPFHVGGFQDNSNHDVTLEMWPGIYGVTGYTYDTDGVADSDSDVSTFNEYTTMAIPPSEMYIYEAQHLVFITSDTSGLGGFYNTNPYVLTTDNGAESIYESSTA